MIRSMTGYGKSREIIGNYDVEAEVKSLNNRYLDLTVRLPKELYSREFEIRNLVKKEINRGKVYVSISLKLQDSAVDLSSFNKDGLLRTVALLKEIKSLSDVDDNITMDHLLNLQHFFMDDLVELSDEEYSRIENLLHKAIEKLHEMRSIEGEELKNDMLRRVDTIEHNVADIESLLTPSVHEYFAKLKSRAEELLADFSKFDDRLSTELALLSEKYDTSEEIVRLRSHIKQFRDILAGGKEVGKKLNFIVQEMNREANTINSKSISTDISYKALAIKEELEKIREQIQNIE